MSMNTAIKLGGKKTSYLDLERSTSPALIYIPH